jgi:hypothetical protein
MSKDNRYFLDWARDEDHVQRDRMSGLVNHEVATIIDHVVEPTPDQLSVSGMLNGVHVEALYTVEKKDRARTVELTRGDKKLIAGGKWTSNGQDVPWINKCGGAASQSSPGNPGTVKAVFEKYKLLGTFAPDCSKPAKPDENLYYVNRLIDPDHVQRDVMETDTKRKLRVTIDKAWEWQPNEIGISGTRDGKATAGLWRLDGGRMVQWESIVATKPEISGGKRVQTGTTMPWLSRCSALQ